MKVLLSIGHNDFVLPNDAGLPSVIKVLSKACPASDRSYLKAGKILVEPVPVQITVRYLGPASKLEIVADRYSEIREEKPAQLVLEAPTTIIPTPSNP